MLLGFETLDLKFRESKLRELTVQESATGQDLIYIYIYIHIHIYLFVYLYVYLERERDYEIVFICI